MIALFTEMIGWDINPHFDPLHLASNLVIVGGFPVLAYLEFAPTSAQEK